jgi:WD40 repeat protein
MSNISASFRGLLLLLFLTSIIFFMFSCQPSVRLPDHKSENQIPTDTLSITPTSTDSYMDFRESLPPGTYIVYKIQDTWQVRKIGIEHAIPINLEIDTYILNRGFSLSHDENLIASTSSPGEISIFDICTGRKIHYKQAGQNYVFNLEWAPDNNTLFYLGTPEDIYMPDVFVGIYGFSVTDKKPLVLVEFVNDIFMYGIHSMSTSPNGHWIAFRVPQMSVIHHPAPEYTVHLMNILCIQEPDSCSDSITQVGENFQPVWTPAGQLSWICSDNLALAICVSDIDGEHLSKIPIVPVDNSMGFQETQISSYTWSPDSKYVALVLDNLSSSSSIYVFSVDDGKLTHVSEEIKRQRVFLAWSPDSRYFAYYEIVNHRSESYGEIELQVPIRKTYIYDVDTGTNMELIDSTIGQEEFGFFIQKK